MKKIKLLIFTFCFVLTCFLLFNGNNFKVNAATVADTLTLHKQTKVYSSNNSDYFDGCEDYTSYVNQSPEITVLTHGLGSKGYYWSNSLSVNNGKELAYNSSSLIEKIYQKLNGNLNLYYAQFEGENFKLHKLSRNDYSLSDSYTARLDDVSKHIVLIYESGIEYASNDDVYDEFHSLLDNISMQYKSLTGVLPRFNLVGHSRGGITNIQYATEHPYNVASLFSLGTPYNGSVLGGIDKVLEMLDYKDPNRPGHWVPGVESLLDYDEAVRIREAWNDAFKSDVNMNVVAYGSMTSIDYIEDMLIDAADGDSEFAPMIQPYLDLMRTVINVVKRHPNSTGSTLNFIKGLALITNAFGINLYDEVLKIVNKDLEGNVTYEEGQKILSLYNVINGQAVIMDDLFIDLNSQLGYGFKDGIDFNGFKRYVKIFQPEDLNKNRSIPTMPAVVHNMETMNKTYTEDIANALEYGQYHSNIINLADDSSTSITLIGEKTYKFFSDYSGTRKFTALNTTIKLYSITNTGTYELLSEVNDSITFNFQKNKTYMIVVAKNNKSNVTISFSLQESLSLSNNMLNISKNDSKIYKFTVQQSGYYLISSSSNNVTITELTFYSPGKYYAYFTANKTNYLKLNNNASYDVTVNISIKDPQALNLEVGEFLVNENQKVMEFTNPYNTSIQYKLMLSWEDSTTKYAYIYNQNNSSIASIISGTKEKTYSFTLDANQKCYIVFSNTDNSIKSKLIVNETQLKWKINGSSAPTTTMLPRGERYNLQLVLVANGKEMDYFSDWTYPQSNHFSLLENSLNISYNALIGYDIIIIPMIAPEYFLTITIGFNNEFSYSVSNSDSIKLNWNMTLYNESLKEISFTIISDGVSTPLKLTSINGEKDILSYISSKSGTSSLRLDYLIISGMKFNNGTAYLNQPVFIINNFFASGTGVSNDPYLIGCYRHLNNIRRLASSNSISGCFKLINDINIPDSYNGWEILKDFYGTFDGNNHKIVRSNIVINNSSYIDSEEGFFRTNHGTIKNLTILDSGTFSHPETLFDPNKVVYSGMFCGSNYGIIDNCAYRASNSTMCFPVPRAYVGGITGWNVGTIKNCVVQTLNIDGYGHKGGIAGYNGETGKIENCQSYGTITNLYRDSEQEEPYSVGGIVGINKGSVYNCSNYAKIRFSLGDSTNTSTDSRVLQPRMGLFIGTNHGSYTNCRNYGSVDTKGLQTVKWTTGSLWWKEEHTFYQTLYCGGYCGEDLNS